MQEEKGGAFREQGKNAGRDSTLLKLLLALGSGPAAGVLDPIINADI